MWVWDPNTPVLPSAFPSTRDRRCPRDLQDGTFGGLTLPDEEGAVRVARCQELPLCILAADIFEEPPGDTGQG